MYRKNMWELYDDKQLAELESLAQRYKRDLDLGKTERECVNLVEKRAIEHGYKKLDDLVKNKTRLESGDRVYAKCMEKTIVLFNIGQNPIEDGMNILGAHLDSPRMDIKQNPLYENTGLAYLDTHYYGGIKKYQWVTIPLSIHGVVVKKDGTRIDVCVGEDFEDPVFVITDLLIHLAQDQLQKKANVVIEGEGLDLLLASRTIDKSGEASEEKDLVKANVLRILKDKYGFEEEDFLSAELEVVPAGRARDCGLDRSMVIGYGQDDRVCAFTSLYAMLEVENPLRTSCCILVDKEEIGSTGATGMQSRFFEDSLLELINLMDSTDYMTFRRTMRNSTMLSSDVSAAYDPLYSSAFEKNNSAQFGKGMVFNKYTGARGKNGSNDANAEYMAALRSVMDDNKVGYQTAELGKVDQGGGGTIAYILASYGMNVIDSGVAVLSMHAPMEVTSKADIYETYKGYKVFLENMTSI